LHHELEVRRLDPERVGIALALAVVLPFDAPGSVAPDADTDPSRPHLLHDLVDEHGVDVVAGRAVPVRLLPASKRLDDRLACSTLVEVLDREQLVVEETRNPLLEPPELRDLVLANGDQEVRPGVARVDRFRELDVELVAVVVAEELLELIEDDQKANALRPALERLERSSFGLAGVTSSNSSEIDA
jgi:hypothetical protein